MIDSILETIHHQATERKLFFTKYYGEMNNLMDEKMPVNGYENSLCGLSGYRRKFAIIARSYSSGLFYDFDLELYE